MPTTESPTGVDLLEAVRAELYALSDPQGGEKNKKHFVMPDGTVVLKCVHWLNSASGEKIADEPEWVRFFPANTNAIRADYVENLPDGEDRDAEHGVGKTRWLKNPLTGVVVAKQVPWIDNGIVLSLYRPGLEVSPGKRIRYSHNPDEEFDDPNDYHNLRFLSDAGQVTRLQSIMGRVGYERHKPMTAREKTEKKTKAICSIAMGGTVLMMRTPDGLASSQSMIGIFEEHLSNSFPHHAYQSVGFPRTRINEKDQDPAYGIDSSQATIDFAGDTVLAMVHAWNRMPPENRKDFSGFVIALGTDSAVEVMSYIKMMLGPNCPFNVIGVAAMHPAGEQSSDALPNILKAHEHLVSLHEQGLSAVALRLEGGLYDPTQTVKINDGQATAFIGKKLVDTERFETVDSVDPSRFYRVYDSDYENPYDKALVLRGENKIDFIPPELSKDVFRVEKAVSDSDAKAFLVETYASMTFPTNVLEAIIRGAKGRPIFCVNPVVGGRTDHGYKVTKAVIGYDGVYALGMTEHAARVKLNYAIRLFGDDQDKIVDFMTRNDFVGEQYEGFDSESSDTIRSANRLKEVLYERLGLTSDIIKQFGIAEFTDQFVVGQARRQIAGIVDAEGDSEVRLYPLYLVLEKMTAHQIIEALDNPDKGLGKMLRDANPGLADAIAESSHSTVAPQGFPIELHVLPETA